MLFRSEGRSRVPEGAVDTSRPNPRSASVGMALIATLVAPGGVAVALAARLTVTPVSALPNRVA